MKSYGAACVICHILEKFIHHCNNNFCLCDSCVCTRRSPSQARAMSITNSVNKHCAYCPTVSHASGRVEGGIELFNSDRRALRVDVSTCPLPLPLSLLFASNDDSWLIKLSFRRGNVSIAGVKTSPGWGRRTINRFSRILVWICASAFFSRSNKFSEFLCRTNQKLSCSIGWTNLSQPNLSWSRQPGIYSVD